MEFQEYPKYIAEAGCIVDSAQHEAAVRSGLAVVEVVHSAQGVSRTVVGVAEPSAPAAEPPAAEPNHISAAPSAGSEE